MGYEIQVYPQSDAASEWTAEAVVPTGSRWFDGHFPGQPVLPGIAQLAVVMAVIRSRCDSAATLNEVSRVRFRKMIVPDDHLTVVVSAKPQPAGSYTFRIIKAQEVVTTGSLKVGRPGSDGN